jgi:hypothetical protein
MDLQLEDTTSLKALVNLPVDKDLKLLIPLLKLAMMPILSYLLSPPLPTSPKL